jgi:hypothetical protein
MASIRYITLFSSQSKVTEVRFQAVEWIPFSIPTFTVGLGAIKSAVEKVRDALSQQCKVDHNVKPTTLSSDNGAKFEDVSMFSTSLHGAMQSTKMTVVIIAIIM